MANRFTPIFIIVLSALLTLVGLNNVAFWDDEAHVGLFAHNFLVDHSNIAWDGRNLIPDHNAAGYDANLQNPQPQLDNYLVAFSFKLLGESTFSGRLPFALCGIGSIILFWFLLRLEFPKQPVLQLYALAACSFSVNLFLYFRTCRYYALSVLLTLGVFYTYRRFLQTKKWIYPVLLGLFAGILSLNSILNCACVLAAISARHFLFHPKEIRTVKEWLNVAASAAVAGAFAIPYAFLYIVPSRALSQRYDQSMGLHHSDGFSAPTLFWWNLKGINLINAIPWTLAAAFAGFVLWSYFSKAKTAREVQPVSKHLLEFAAAVGGFVLLLSLISPQQVDQTSIADVRYLTPMLPVMAIIVGGLLWYIDRLFRPAAIAVLILSLASNVLAYTPGAKVHWILPDYLREISNPYPTGCSEAVAYLRKNANQDDTVWFTPDFMGKPLMFYIGDKLKLRGILDDRTILPQEAIKKLNDPSLFIECVYPDWIVAFGAQPDLTQAIRIFSREHTEGDRTVRYQYHLVKALDVYWNQTQRPELPWHTFGTYLDFNKRGEAVYIFKRSAPQP